MTQHRYLLKDKRFLDAVDLFNSKQWYKSHDLFEELWHELFGAERRTIQAILQVAVAELHLEKGNLKGATILYGEALGRLQTSNTPDLGFKLYDLCKILKARLAILQRNEIPEETNSPILLNKI